MDHVFGVVSKMSLPNPRSLRFSLVLPSRNFTVLCFTFMSMTHFELIFVTGVRSACSFIFLFVCLFLHHPVGPAPFVGEIVCSPLYYQLIMFMRVYFWGLYSILILGLSILLPVPYFLDY